MNQSNHICFTLEHQTVHTFSHCQRTYLANFNTQLFFLATDGVSYEVEDPQENYDDIDAPEITQTEAEVHASPQTMPEREVKPELVEGDDDYLVPGQEE